MGDNHAVDDDDDNAGQCFFRSWPWRLMRLCSCDATGQNNKTLLFPVQTPGIWHALYRQRQVTWHKQRGNIKTPALFIFKSCAPHFRLRFCIIPSDWASRFRIFGDWLTPLPHLDLERRSAGVAEQKQEAAKEGALD